ncbi:NAD(P)/FAD-dependent oxidoreductase [Halapricum desulfuricans]|uniref:Putative NAD/FAD-dependent oxidoreductase n=1 Tax=Halapricum desulfuricans TaxID=2841257 RepID=A0A897N114_9EURY|nr:FAD-dependent oxidoreductase [Halapricum desulfuricans]QSG06191.1 putative NAD/FAD-dependent oxidoreductase [Halapricum desulfuricans]
MTTIGVVGAGAAAAAATHVVDQALEDAEVTMLEKSGGLCGRAATRRRGPVTYDYGANYLKDDDSRVTELITETLDAEGLVDTRGPIYAYESDGEINPGRDSDDRKWSYEGGLTQIAKRLLDRTEATVHRNTRVERIHREGEQWRLTDADGQSWGPFDALVVNPPAPQTADLLRTAEWADPLREDLIEATDAVPYRSVWTAVLHYPFELDRPYYAVINTDAEHEIGWVAREECKPGHVPDGESLLVVQAGQDWSERHLERDPETNVAELIDLTAELLDDARLSEPDWTDYQGWRYALPDEPVRQGPIDSATDHDLYFVGDWVSGEARLHAALRNGLDTGEKLVYGL